MPFVCVCSVFREMMLPVSVAWYWGGKVIICPAVHSGLQMYRKGDKSVFFRKDRSVALLVCFNPDVFDFEKDQRLKGGERIYTRWSWSVEFLTSLSSRHLFVKQRHLADGRSLTLFCITRILLSSLNQSPGFCFRGTVSPGSRARMP